VVRRRLSREQDLDQHANGQVGPKRESLTRRFSRLSWVIFTFGCDSRQGVGRQKLDRAARSRMDRRFGSVTRVLRSWSRAQDAAAIAAWSADAPIETNDTR
jgi:hypothetical protein